METLVLRLLKEVRRRDPRIRIVTFLASGRKGVLDEEYRKEGVELLYANGPFHGLLDFYRHLRRLEPDVVHSHLLLASGFYQAVAWLAGVRRRVSHIHNTGYDRADLLFAVRNFIYRFFLNAFSTRVAGVSDATRPLAGTPDAKWVTIYNGVAEYTGRPEGEPLWAKGDKRELDIVFLARFFPQKNPVRAVDVAEAVMRRLPDRRVRLHFFGRTSEPLASQVRERAVELGISESVLLYGQTDRPDCALRDADLLLLTSLREGLPMGVIEALSSGLPVLSSDIGPIAEIQRHCEGIRTVPLAASNERWSEAAAELLELDRDDIAHCFARSPFVYERHYEEVLKLWHAPT